VPFWVMVLVVVAIFFVSSDPPIVLFLLFCGYAVSGYLYWAWRRWRGESNPARPAPRAETAPPH
jgi:CDP-diacylglycerol--serine O-phosphatidyltransferase